MGLSPELREHGATISGRYSIRRKLGSGSLGTVYLAHDASRGHAVALKVIRTDRVTSRSVTSMQREFRAVASLNHRQIATAFDFGYTEKENLPFYTHEYVPGVPLPAGPPGEESPRDFLRPIIDVLDALEYLHSHDILHLDIHPGNLILAEDGDRGGVLVDFGLVASVDPFFGSQYGGASGALPPELLKKGRAATPSTDVFLVGRLLHYRLTGRMDGEVRLPREIPGWGPRLTLDLERIAVKALQPDMEQRFSSAREFHQALSQVLGEPDRPRCPVNPRELMVGRAETIEAIEEGLREVGAGRPVVAGFAGKRGIGKSRLLEEVRLRAQLRGFEVVSVGRTPDAGRGPVLIKELGRAEGRKAGLAGWLKPLSTRHGGSPRERARRAAEVYFVQDSRPLVLLLDDLDSVDQESRVLVDALLDTCRERRAASLKGRGLGLFLSATERDAFRGRLDEVHILKPLRRDAARTLFRSLLGSMALPEDLVRDGLLRSRGVPLLIRRLANAILEAWGTEGVVPAAAELPIFNLSPGTVEDWEWSRYSEADRGIVDVLGIIGRPASRGEIAAALEVPESECTVSLRRLEASEVIDALGRGRARRYHLRLSPAADEIRSRWPESKVRGVHERLAKLLGSHRGSGARDLENLARHLLLAGRADDGRTVGLEAARRLCALGSFDRAVRLLEAVASCQSAPTERLKLMERISETLEEIGDHRAGIRILEPFCASELSGVPCGQRTRVRRCLGIHYHRAGMADRALEVFEEVRRSADPVRDVEDLVFIDSELAEIHTFSGRHDAAEEACRRGLERLDRRAVSPEFRGRMEVILRASLGHLELRRMRLERARDELSAALELSRRYGALPTREAVLNNLGVTLNQLNQFGRARRSFREAERLLLASGEHRGTIKIACNLGVIAAKLGEPGEAHRQVERASRTLRYHPDPRLEFFVHYTRGVVALLLGDARGAIEGFERGLPLGRELGDLHLVRFGEVYLAEACLASGHYKKALQLLEAAARQGKESPHPLLSRMIHARLFLLGALLGRGRLAARSRRTLGTVPRTDVEILEAWNDIYHALACSVSDLQPAPGEGGPPQREADRAASRSETAESATGEHAARRPSDLESAMRVFERFELPYGLACARIAALSGALASKDRDAVKRWMRPHSGESTSGHRFLAVAEPLVRAEAAFFLGEAESAEEALAAASGAIVGSPFLELDWRLELLRARVAFRKRDVQEARRNFHRSAHTRELLAQLVPAAARARFLRHPRFETLEKVGRHLEKPPRVVFSTELLRRSLGYEGMIGQSSAMAEVYQLIDRVAVQEIPVLIRGATGTGKELVARALHRRSTRNRARFMAIHCAALPGELFESELFGCSRGAYTGAEEDRPGLLENLEGGTILLDEVSQLSVESQAKLMHVIDSGLVRRLGSVEARNVDVRFLATTSRDLGKAVKEGAFRDDLFYRLGSLEIRLPTLSDRREDIALLARHFMERHAARLERAVPVLTSGAIRLLESYAWPGNVRELESVLLRVLVCLSRDDVVTTGDIEPLLAPPADAPPRRSFSGRSLPDLKLELERDYLTELFLRVEGDPEKMMKDLGVKRSQLYAWFRKLGIDVRELRGRLGP